MTRFIPLSSYGQLFEGDSYRVQTTSGERVWAAYSAGQFRLCSDAGDVINPMPLKVLAVETTLSTFVPVEILALIEGAARKAKRLIGERRFSGAA